MAHGGHRKGAGRKQSALTTKTRKIAEEAIADGLTPLEVMLTAMRTHADAMEWDEAAAIAKDAAPYMHPRLAAIEHTGKDGGPIQTQEISDEVRARALAVFLAKIKGS